MTSPKLSDLHHDRRGAVMITGVFMAMFLIGTVWFLIGIGDALVYRDTMQEAADHAVFTSAAIHAKGMNFISACNLILLVLVAIHVIMGIVSDVLLLVCGVGALFTAGRSCEPWLKWDKLWNGYAKVLPPIARVVHKAELAAAYGYPFVAEVQGLAVGASDYDAFTPTLSTSLIPGKALTGPLNKLTRRKGKDADGNPTTNDNLNADPADDKKGLPVKGEKFSYLCKKVGRVAVDGASRIANFQEGGGLVKRFIKSLAGPTVSSLYCGGSDFPGAWFLSLLADAFHPKFPGGFWDEEGPLVPWGGGGNGEPWYQVWALAKRPGAYEDTSQPRVGIAARLAGLRTPVESHWYNAQAEFYFDCDQAWKHDACNGWSGDDNAAFAIKWRARLVRTDLPAIGTLLATFGFEFLKTTKGYKGLKKGLNSKQQGDFVDQGFKELEHIIKNGVFKPAGKAVDPHASGIYH